jgi:hypothetical protein
MFVFREMERERERKRELRRERSPGMAQYYFTQILPWTNTVSVIPQKRVAIMFLKK